MAARHKERGTVLPAPSGAAAAARSAQISSREHRDSKKGESGVRHRHTSPLDAFKLEFGDVPIDNLKKFVGQALEKLKLQNNYIERTIQNEAPPSTVHAILDQC